MSSSNAVPGLSMRRPSLDTRPARISAWAFARLSARPRSTRSWSARRFAKDRLAAAPGALAPRPIVDRARLDVLERRHHEAEEPVALAAERHRDIVVAGAAAQNIGRRRHAGLHRLGEPRTLCIMQGPLNFR